LKRTCQILVDILGKKLYNRFKEFRKEYEEEILYWRHEK